MSEARDLLELRNEIYRKALLTVGTYEETAKSIGSADSDVVKREANRKAFGAEYALKTYNKDVGEKQPSMSHRALPTTNTTPHTLQPVVS